MRLDLSSFQNALQTLHEGLMSFNNAPDNVFVRDACIQRFAYCYELSHKMLRRFLEATEPSLEGVDALSFPDLVRLGQERGLLNSSWEEWKRFRAARNVTSHTYDAQKAMEVLAVLPAFLQEAKGLCVYIDMRQAD